MLAGARKDGPQVTPEWQKIQPSIDGVLICEVLHVPRDHGVITEIYRPEWDETALPSHARTIDRLFINQGHVKVVGTTVEKIWF